MQNIVGMAIPFNETGVAPLGSITTTASGRVHRLPGRETLRQRVCHGAFSPATLDAPVDFRIDHAECLEGVNVRLFVSRGGLYFWAGLPNSDAARDLLRARHANPWLGVSLEYVKSSAKRVIDWPSVTAYVTNIECVTAVSLQIKNLPNYFHTWADVIGPASYARIARENSNAIAKVFRDNYKQTHPRAWWAPPPQAAWAEAILQQQNPERAFLLARGDIKSRW